MPNITEAAMLARLSISLWSARKFDRQASDDVTTRNNAKIDAARVNKALIDAPALKEVQKSAGLARRIHMANSLPWIDDGSRILPSANFFEYSRQMKEARQDFEAAVDKFLGEYPSLVLDAAARLGDLYRPEEFPHENDVARRFSFGFHYLPLPDSRDWRVNMAEADSERIREEIEKTMQDATADAMRDLYERTAEAVGAMADKLAAYQPAIAGENAKNVFRDSLVTNVRKVADLLPRLNVTNDERLAAVAQDIEAKLIGIDAAQLRANDDDRRDVQEAAADIMQRLSAYTG